MPNTYVDDLEKVLNMRNAWKYILENMNKSLSLHYICKINGFITYKESLE